MPQERRRVKGFGRYSGGGWHRRARRGTLAANETKDDDVNARLPPVPRSLDRARVLRAAFHAFNCLWGVLAYHFVVPRVVAAAAIGTIAAAFGIVEGLRLRSESLNAQVLDHPLFRNVIRPSEHHRLSGAFWFVLGVALVLAIYPKEAVEGGCLVMGFGDPAATLVGTRFGRVRIGAGRTLEGTLAFVAAAFVAVSAFRFAAYPSSGIAWTLGFAAVAVLAGAVAEGLLSRRINDNFTVPLVSCGACAAYAALVAG
jgi:diacylglycerol kinase (CTP)